MYTFCITNAIERDKKNTSSMVNLQCQPPMSGRMSQLKLFKLNSYLPAHKPSKHFTQPARIFRPKRLVNTRPKEPANEHVCVCV